MIDYQRVAKAITYIKENSTEQPTLDDIAEAVHLSPYHFHRIFKKWAGMTPKDFLQYISLEHAKKLLDDNQTLDEASLHTGLSSTSRLYDLFVNIEGMTPGEFKNGGQTLEIQYHISESPFGPMIMASTGKGICNLLFVDSKKKLWRSYMKSGPTQILLRAKTSISKICKKYLLKIGRILTRLNCIFRAQISSSRCGKRCLKYRPVI